MGWWRHGRRARRALSVVMESETPDAHGRAWRDGSFEAVRSAIDWGIDPVAASLSVGLQAGAARVRLADALDGLWWVYRSSGVSAPPAEVAAALVEGWNRAQTTAAHTGPPCLDPDTGISTVEHLRTRLAEELAEAAEEGRGERTGLGLVVVDLPTTEPGDPDPVAEIVAAIQTALPSRIAVARAAPGRIVTLVRLDECLEIAAASLHSHLDASVPSALVWAEPVPASGTSIDTLLTPNPTPNPIPTPTPTPTPVTVA